jgi:hypothetical protein
MMIVRLSILEKSQSDRSLEDLSMIQLHLI